MSTVALVVTVVGLVAGTVLLWRLPTPAPPDRTPELLARLADTSVVIPARDEERTLPLLLASLAAQVVPPREVIVVDDGSADATSAVAAGAGAMVIPGGSPPAGWLGKPWACAQGAAAATGSTLVLLDADVVLAPDALLRLVADHRDESIDGLLSVQPFHAAGPGVEQLSALANLVAVMASGIAAPTGAAAVGRSPVAFGPCLVTSRAALIDVGGFAAARGSITEDVALAAAFRRNARPVRCLAGAGTVRFRMYPGGWGPLVQGWSRNLAAGAGQAPLLPTVGATTWVAALVIVGVAGVAALLDVATGATPRMLALLAWATVAVHLRWALAKVGAFRWWCAALFPVPLAALVVLFIRSVALRVLRRPVAWRGRRVCHGAVLR